MLAISKGDLRCVEELLARGVDLNAARFDAFGQQYTSLWYALRTQNPEHLAEKLLRHGADPNLRDNDGCTVLVRAAQSGQTEAVRVLLRYGADVRATGVGSILHVEKVKDHAAVVRLLQEAGARD
jgi:ankyrin repeat protein